MARTQFFYFDMENNTVIGPAIFHFYFVYLKLYLYIHTHSLKPPGFVLTIFFVKKHTIFRSLIHTKKVNFITKKKKKLPLLSNICLVIYRLHILACVCLNIDYELACLMVFCFVNFEFTVRFKKCKRNTHQIVYSTENIIRDFYGEKHQ